MGRIRGMNVTLYEKQQAGADDFGAPIIEEVPVKVKNVLVGQPTTDDITNVLSLYGKKLVYTLAIPKGDAHSWEDSIVEFWGERFKTFGFMMVSMPENTPTDWSMKVMVERYE